MCIYIFSIGRVPTDMSRYIREFSPTSVRGALTTGPQLLITLGLVTGFFTCYRTPRIDSSFSWRTPFIVLAYFSAVFSIAAYLWLTPSPRWLTLHGRKAEAAETWDLLGVGLAEQEEVEIEEIRGSGSNTHQAELERQHAETRPRHKLTKHGFFRPVLSRCAHTYHACSVPHENAAAQRD